MQENWVDGNTCAVENSHQIYYSSTIRPDGARIYDKQLYEFEMGFHSMNILFQIGGLDDLFYLLSGSYLAFWHSYQSNAGQYWSTFHVYIESIFK